MLKKLFFLLFFFILSVFAFSANSYAQYGYIGGCVCSEDDWYGIPCLTYADICYNEKHDVPSESYTSGNWRYTVTVTNPCNVDAITKIWYGYSYTEPYIAWYDGDVVSIPANTSKNFYKTLTFNAYWGWYNYSPVAVLVNALNNSYVGKGYYEVRTDQMSACPPAAPTATPIPASCPVSQQQTGFSGSGTPLMNDYNTTQYKGSTQYTVFTANKNGKVNKAEIYGTLDRAVAKGNKVLQCKITNSTGSVNLGESATNSGPFTKGALWMGVQFTTPVNLINGTTYRLYCKVNNLAGGGALYWLDNWQNRTDKAYRLYMCE